MKAARKISYSLCFCLAFFSFARAQEFYYYPYYGKNKIMYENFQWKSYTTEHFQIYFYTDNPEIMKNIAEVAESAYQKISELLTHQLADPVPLIFYTTYTDFEQTNLFQISEGVLGVSEPILYRIAVHGDMPFDELQNLVEHELTHIFEFDILWGGPGAALYAVSQPPLWMFEGLSEYTTQKWSSWSLMVVRDAALNDRIPELGESGELTMPFPTPRDPAYDFGHAIYDFIEDKYGKNGIKDLWQSVKNSPLIGRLHPLRKAFQAKPYEFNHQFKKWLREKNRKFLLRENPEDYSIALGPQFPLNPYYFSFSHAVSPSGDLIAALTYSVIDAQIDLVLISTQDGRVVKNITQGFTTQYEYIKFEYDPSLGPSLAWSPDGDEIVFFGRDERRYSLYLIDPMRGTILKKFNIDYDRPAAPCFFPDGQALLFTAFSRGFHDIFKLDLETKDIVNLTQDVLFEKAPSISPDGKSLAYTLRVGTQDKLFLSPLANLKKRTQLTFGEGNTNCPAFSADSQEIYFSGDARESFNIYSLDLTNGEKRRYSDVWTGNFFPKPHPKDPKKIIFAAFNKGAYQIFSAELEALVEDRVAFAELSEEEIPDRFAPVVAMDIDEEKIKPFKGLDKVYISGRPPIDVTVSSDGSIFGGSAVAFSDLLGDHSFYAMIFQTRGYRSYLFSYLNQKRRLQFMPTFFDYTFFYYIPYAYFDPVLYNYLNYNDAIAYRKITSASISAYYPLDRYYRLEANFGFYRYEESFADPYTMSLYGSHDYGYFWNGNVLSLSFSFVGETTHFNPNYGPRAGHTFRLAAAKTLPVADNFFSNATLQADLRKYFYIGAEILFALRFEGWASLGKDPFVFYYGGNNQVRSVYYNNLISSQGWFGNAEFRFPLLNAASTLIGNIGPVRGALFFDITRSKLGNRPAQFVLYTEFFKPPLILDAIGSFGYGFEFFFLGLPIHVEFVKQLHWRDFSNPLIFQAYGKFQTRFWIGLDF